MIRSGRNVGLAVLVLLLGGCGSFPDTGEGPYPESTPGEAATRLAQVFEVLEDQSLSVLINQDNCRLIEYRSGTFSQHRVEWCVENAATEPVPFTAEATTDFDRLVEAVDVGRARFSSANLHYDQDGKLRRATFTFAYNFGSEVLVFDPGYLLPDDEPGERSHEAVDSDWYLVKVDWN